MNTSAFITAIRKADTAVASAHARCNDAALVLFADFDAEKGEKDEYSRLMGVARTAVKDAKIVLKHERNVLQFIGQHLLVAMAPAQLIEIPKAKGAIIKPASEAKGAREIAAAAKQIRDAVGLSDARSNPRGKKAPKVNTRASAATDVLKSLAGLLKRAETREAVFKAIEAAGYKVTKSK